MIWSSCTRFMTHKFKPAEFHAATCCGVKILSPKTRNLFIKSSQIRGLASASCPCFMTHKLKPAEFNATCCRDKFCPHNGFFNTTTQHNVCQEGWEGWGGGGWTCLYILSLLHDMQIQTSWNFTQHFAGIELHVCPCHRILCKPKSNQEMCRCIGSLFYVWPKTCTTKSSPS